MGAVIAALAAQRLSVTGTFRLGMVLTAVSLAATAAGAALSVVARFSDR